MDSNLQKFTAPGRIAFRDGALAPIAVLVSPHGAAEVSLYGAHVLSYRPIGHGPVLWLAQSHKTVAAGKAIRGGIPVCWPWFGAAETAGLPAHGFVRNRVWSVVSTEYDKDTTSITLGILDDDETMALWPFSFRLELKVTMGESLTLELTTINTGDKPFEISEALHTYLRVKDVEGIQVTGLDGQPYIDKAPGGKDGVQSGAITFAGETDRVYNRHDGLTLINDMAIKRRIVVEKEKSRATVVWNPWHDKASGMADMDEGGWKNFICVETANALGEPIIVEPGRDHTMKAKITALLFELKAPDAK